MRECNKAPRAIAGFTYLRCIDRLDPAEASKKQGVELSVVKLPEVKLGFVPSPRRWVVERSFARLTLMPRSMYLASLPRVILAMLMN